MNFDKNNHRRGKDKCVAAFEKRLTFFRGLINVLENKLKELFQMLRIADTISILPASLSVADVCVVVDVVVGGVYRDAP